MYLTILYSIAERHCAGLHPVLTLAISSIVIAVLCVNPFALLIASMSLLTSYVVNSIRFYCEIMFYWHIHLGFVLCTQ